MTLFMVSKRKYPIGAKVNYDNVPCIVSDCNRQGPYYSIILEPSNANHETKR